MNNSDCDRDAMEDFFDNLLDEQQRKEFLDRHETDEAFERQLQLQNRIDQVLMAPPEKTRYGVKIPESKYETTNQ